MKSIVPLNPEALPPFISIKHVMFICSCSRSKAFEIMQEPHRIVWNHGGIRRLDTAIFLEQLKQECKKASA